MESQVQTETNVQQAVPFFNVKNIEESIRFYIDGLGFEMGHRWIDEGKLRWCWLKHGGAALMLQEYRTEGHDFLEAGRQSGRWRLHLFHLQGCSGHLSRGDDAQHSGNKAFCGKQHVGDFHDRS